MVPALAASLRERWAEQHDRVVRGRERAQVHRRAAQGTRQRAQHALDRMAAQWEQALVDREMLRSAMEMFV